MTITAFYLRIIRRVGFLNKYAQSVIRKKVMGVKSREKLNKWYNKRNIDEKVVFQNIFCKIFRNTNTTIEDGLWTVNFMGKEIVLPLKKESSWLDWDNAVSIVAHDPDVKITYENLLSRDKKIKTFFDIGANYGTHSMLFLSQGIRTISFEPNPGLKIQFENLCQLNNLAGNMESYAIGDTKGAVNLFFPTDATWLGTIVNSEVDFLKGSHELQKIEVPLITLDEYVQTHKIQPDLIKIDTEGNEINVLRGATEVIKNGHPLIVFESNSPKGRKEIWTFFNECKYKVYDLPFGNSSQLPLPGEEFFNSQKFNFIAVPEQLPV
ncbi:MAG: FkbM family methyltransferase [Chitinophagaceae bacterium]